jgi:hypothetical protein
VVKLVAGDRAEEAVKVAWRLHQNQIARLQHLPARLQSLELGRSKSSATNQR